MMSRLWAVAALVSVILPAAADQTVLRGSLLVDAHVASSDAKEPEARQASDPPTPSPGSDGESEEVKARIEAEVEERLKRREEEKKKEEEKDEETETYSNFLLFGLLGLAALIRFVCKALPEKESSSYLILQEASPANHREKQNGRAKPALQSKSTVDTKMTVSSDKSRRPPTGSR